MQEFEFKTWLRQPQTCVYYPEVQTVEDSWALSWSPEELEQAQTTEPTLGGILAWMNQERQRAPPPHPDNGCWEKSTSVSPLGSVEQTGSD